ncbi:hypothetical protein ACOMHN_066296 [Nucella lapillus]
MDVTVLLSSYLFLGLLISLYASGTTAVSSKEGFGFVHDSSFDGRQVTNDADRLQLVTPSLSRCAVTCAMYDWCSSFFYTRATGACSLHATAFVGPSFAALSAGTRYFKQTEDWCPTTSLVVYNRPAEMCVYIEASVISQEASLAAADRACASRGMRLARDISPIKMTALVNITTKNKDSYKTSLFVGLRRTGSGQSTFEWIDGTPLNTSAMQPFWEANQPNGASTGQDCVVMRASVDSTINDVTCNPHGFICEKTQR